MAAPSSKQSEFEVPEGWMMVKKRNKKGELVKCYTNILGQRFYSESDLVRHINYAKERGFSIYAPDFVPPTTGPFAMGSKPNAETASSSNPKHATVSNIRRGGSTSKNKLTKLKNQKEVGKGHKDAGRLVDEVQTEDEIQCAKALLEISGQRSVDRRASRRISGRQPELQIDFDFNRPLEYSYMYILGQRFYTESNLVQHINYAQERGFSIHAPDFVLPTTGPFAMGSKPNIETASSSNPKHASISNERRGGPTLKNKLTKPKNQKEVGKGHQDAQRLVDEVQTEDETQCASQGLSGNFWPEPV